MEGAEVALTEPSRAALVPFESGGRFVFRAIWSFFREMPSSSSLVPPPPLQVSRSQRFNFADFQPRLVLSSRGCFRVRSRTDGEVGFCLISPVISSEFLEVF